MKIYHGSYIPVEMPKILKSKFPKDFGKGFYCTEIEQQAIRWASRFDTAVVSIFEYTPDKNLKILVFDSGKKHNFDIVIGAMANDQIFNYISDFISGIITREQFWVIAKFKHPTHQICFCSEKALQTIQFIDYNKIK